MNPMRALQMAKSMGVQPKKIVIVGCQPRRFRGGEQGRMGLSEPVQAAVREAVAVIERWKPEQPRETKRQGTEHTFIELQTV